MRYRRGGSAQISCIWTAKKWKTAPVFEAVIISTWKWARFYHSAAWCFLSADSASLNLQIRNTLELLLSSFPVVWRGQFYPIFHLTQLTKQIVLMIEELRLLLLASHYLQQHKRTDSSKPISALSSMKWEFWAFFRFCPVIAARPDDENASYIAGFDDRNAQTYLSLTRWLIKIIGPQLKGMWANTNPKLPGFSRWQPAILPCKRFWLLKTQTNSGDLEQTRSSRVSGCVLMGTN
jgi:hypothetical protein